MTDGSSIELYWIPLGADGNPLVRWGGRLYEAVSARRAHRRPCPLFHSALVVHADGHPHAIEMGPVWSMHQPDRGVVGEGPVGHPWLGRSAMFRYEIRCWRDGVIPDLHAAVGGPVTLATGDDRARTLLRLVPACPTPTWGLDELHAGEMWNSNSLVSWLLECTGLAAGTLRPPAGGRAPGWGAGRLVARRPTAGRAPERAPG